MTPFITTAKLHGRSPTASTNTSNRQPLHEVDYTYRFKPQRWRIPSSLGHIDNGR
ncbi:hypothetical protein [Hoylesella buccalis]|uniref:hypothetical protein n=1 Tax=Hoylesella buccalis TaxID=28127 RepID=UPI0015E157CD|nr:hypothetical protein [Hoylesella buccalis]